MSTDITVNSANSGAITAALKTPTADIKYVPSRRTRKISPPTGRPVPRERLFEHPIAPNLLTTNRA